MSTTLNRSSIVLPLPPMHTGFGYGVERAAFLYTALDSGWVRVQYTKGDGTRVTRLCTRNPSIVGTYGNSSDVRTIRDWEDTNDLSDDQILYYDHLMGGLRSFRVSQVMDCSIDRDCPENNH